MVPCLVVRLARGRRFWRAELHEAEAEDEEEDEDEDDGASV